MALKTPTAFSIWRGLCMSGRKILGPTAYLQLHVTWRENGQSMGAIQKAMLLRKLGSNGRQKLTLDIRY